MKQLLIILALLVFLLQTPPLYTKAQDAPLSLKPGKEVELLGSGFGEYGPYSNICFNTPSSCFSYGNVGISSWLPHKIVFLAPLGLPTFGTISIYPTHSSTAIIEVEYKLHPKITEIRRVDSQQVVSFAKPRDHVVVHGLHFGSQKGAVNVGLVTRFWYGPSAKIVSWTETQIEIELPMVSASTQSIVLTRKGSDTVIFDNFSVELQVPSDPLLHSQHYLRSARVFDMWQASQQLPSSDVLVAVIDSSVNLNHPDLQGRTWENTLDVLGDGVDNDNNGYVDDVYGWNFLLNSHDVSAAEVHGTGVAGIIAASGNNAIGISGIAGNAKIMPLVACSETSGCATTAVIQAIRYAVDNGARIINMSLAGSTLVDYSKAYDDAVQYAVNHGVALVVAAGNGDLLSQGLNTSSFKLSPVCNELQNWQIIGVGAYSSISESPASWSNFGRCVDVYAPGERIFTLSITPSATKTPYDTFSGTSFSAPIVSGILAQLFSYSPRMSAQKAYEYLVAGLDKGQVNAQKTFDLMLTSYAPAADTGIPWNIPVSLHIPSTPTVSEFIGADIIEPPPVQKIELMFSDVVPNNRNREAIEFLAAQGIVAGYEDGTFRPGVQINRAEFTKIVIGAVYKGKVSGGDCFPDVRGEWFAPYVCTAKGLGIVGGNPDGSFRPADTIDTASAYKIVLEAFVGSEDIPVAKGEWYAKYVQYAVDNGLGHERILSPAKAMTRGGMAQLVFNVLQK